MIQAGKLKGTIRFYGTPAEESIGGKAYMIREGLFKDVDVALAWHPDSETKADTDSSQAMVDFSVEFFGKDFPCCMSIHGMAEALLMDWSFLHTH